LKSENKRIVIISDSTGKTARRLLDAVLAQYTKKDVRYVVENIYRQVRSKKEVDEILAGISDDHLVIFTIIKENLRKHIDSCLEERGIFHLDVLAPMMSTLSRFLGVHPDYEPGLLHKVDDEYYKKIDAIGFTVEHDDGLGSQIEEAEIVLVGPSRTSKTPIAMYLTCNYGVKVANVVIVRDEFAKKQLLEKLQRVDPATIFGLFMQPDILAELYEKRAEGIFGDHFGEGKAGEESYFNEVREKIRFCRMLYNEQNWEIIDVTRRSIEDIAKEIFQILESTLRENVRLSD